MIILEYSNLFKRTLWEIYMGLIEDIGGFFLPKLEIEADRYYREFLKKDDAAYLGSFVRGFGRTCTIPLAILAVGSSTFPKSHWEDNASLKNRYTDVNIPTTYKDINLILVPEREEITFFALETCAQEALVGLGMPFDAKQNTPMVVKGCHATECGEDEVPIETVAPFLYVGHGIHSLSTGLHNGTKLDLILGRKADQNMIAEQKIAQERRDRCTFSVLYRGK